MVPREEAYDFKKKGETQAVHKYFFIVFPYVILESNIKTDLSCLGVSDFLKSQGL